MSASNNSSQYRARDQRDGSIGGKRKMFFTGAEGGGKKGDPGRYASLGRNQGGQSDEKQKNHTAVRRKASVERSG